MAVPKKRTSRTRSRMRRSTWRIKAAASSVCPQCHEPKLPHRICPNCGHYGGRRQVMEQTSAAGAGEA